jgi:hypothetical protein
VGVGFGVGTGVAVGVAVGVGVGDMNCAISAQPDRESSISSAKSMASAVDRAECFMDLSFMTSQRNA